MSLTPRIDPNIQKEITQSGTKTINDLFNLFNLNYKQESDKIVLSKSMYLYIGKIEIQGEPLYTYIMKLSSSDIDRIIKSIEKRKLYLDDLIEKNRILFKKLDELKRKDLSKWSLSIDIIDEIISRIIKLQIKVILYKFRENIKDPTDEFNNLKKLIEDMTKKVEVYDRSIEAVYPPQSGGSLTNEVKNMYKCLKYKLKIASYNNDT